MSAMPAVPDFRQRLSSPELRRLVEQFVRRRVPEVEVDDIVQTVFCDALASDRAPDDAEQLRKWLVGITRHKVADFHRRGGRRKHVPLPEQLEGEAAPHDARDLADWAEKQIDSPDNEQTLEWMAREGSGEKLAHIAADEKLPPAQVRQRVSRLRRLMKQRWGAEVAAVAAVGVLVLVAYYLLRTPEQPIAKPIEPDVVPSATVPPPVDPKLERAVELRAEAETACTDERWHECRDRLNEARRLDPAGERQPSVVQLRNDVAGALGPDDGTKQQVAPPTTVPSTTPAPRPTAAPPPTTAPVFSSKPPPPNPPVESQQTGKKRKTKSQVTSDFDKKK